MVYGKTVAIVGGDLRQAHLANTFAEKNSNYKIYGMFLEKDVKLSPNIHKSNDINLVFKSSDIVIFPLPILGPDGMVNTPQSDQSLSIEECIGLISPKTLVLGGMLPPEIQVLLKERKITFIDYFKREEFAIFNAVPTALYKMR